MGNVKSRNDFAKSNRQIARNLSQPQLTTPAATLSSERELELVKQQQTRDIHVKTKNDIITAVGGPLVASIEVGNANDHNKIQQNNWAKEDTQPKRKQRQQKAADSSAACAVAQDEQEQKQQQQRRQQQQQQRLKQASFWSLGSLNWNLSFSGRNSYKQRQKSLRKSFSTLQCHRRSKTQWHRPLTNAIFSSHFKESSRNGEFHIERLVAKGAFGVVFKVVDKKALQQREQQQQNTSNAQNLVDLKITTPAVYALKVLKKSKIISESSVQQIKDEADIQKLCGHNPFIVKQFDLWQNRHNLHILSEFVPNGELFSKISSFSLNLIRVYLAEIALALDFLHNAGIIYRDAKPENILLTADYHLKLTDFGLSKWLKFGLTTNTICGTFQYMGTI